MTERYEQAEPLYQKAVDNFRKLLGSHHIQVAFILSNQAGLYTKMKRYDLAEAMYREALAILEENKLVHQKVVIVIENYLRVLRALGRQDDMEPLHQKIKLLQEKINNPSSSHN